MRKIAATPQSCAIFVHDWTVCERLRNQSWYQEEGGCYVVIEGGTEAIVDPLALRQHRVNERRTAKINPTTLCYIACSDPVASERLYYSDISPLRQRNQRLLQCNCTTTTDKYVSTPRLRPIKTESWCYDRRRCLPLLSFATVHLNNAHTRFPRHATLLIWRP